MSQLDSMESIPPPSAIEIEKSLLASLIMHTDLVHNLPLKPDIFYSRNNQVAFWTITQMHSNGKDVHVDTLAEQLKGLIEEPEIFLADLMQSEFTLNIQTHIEILLDKYRRRRAIETASTLVKHAYSDEPFSIVPEIANLNEIQNIGFHSIEKNIFTPDWNNKPEDRSPLIELSNVRILSRGNISMITADAGAGKSSLLEAGCSSVLNPFNDTLGLVFNVKSVLFIDTERANSDHHASWVRFMRRSGFDQGYPSPDSVKWENIRGIDRLEERLSYLWSRIDSANAPDLVLIDGIGDFVSDVNNSMECTTLIYKLCSIVNNRNIGALLTLHNNPIANKEKARGVLGSELWRKCESVLIIEKLENGIRKLTTDYAMGKNRSASDKISSCFKWDDTQKMHVSCNEPDSVSLGSGKVMLQREKILSSMQSRKFTHTELTAMIMQECGIAQRTAKDRITELLTSGKVFKLNNLYQSASSAEVVQD